MVIAIYKRKCTYIDDYHCQLAAWDSCNLSYGVCLIVGVAPQNTKLCLEAEMIISGRTMKGVCLGGRWMNRWNQFFDLMKLFLTL